MLDGKCQVMDIGKRRAFTLIELLVVIAIIALLLSILIPSLRIAKQKAIAILCLFNQKNIILAWQTYNVDNDGKIVNGYCYDLGMRSQGGDGCWVEPSQDDNGTYLGTPGLDIPLAYRLNGLRKGLLFPYLNTIDVFHCPGDRRFKKGTSIGSSPAYQIYRTYSISDSAIANEERDARCAELGYRTAKRITEIRSPANKYILVEEPYDGRAINYNDASWNFNYLGGYFWDPLGIYHNDSCTLSYADTHAESYKFRDPRTIEYFTDRAAYEARYGSRPSENDNEDVRYFKNNWPGTPINR